MSYTTGRLWDGISQPQAAMVSKNMYSGNSYVESDLVNSYAWDTAIVYIQEMGNINYANKIDGNGTSKNTGETGDQVCNIFDMAGNLCEWTTEYSTITYSSVDVPCTMRGGYYTGSDYYASGRNFDKTINDNISSSFRPLLWVK